MTDGVRVPVIPRGDNAVPVWGKGQVGQPTTNYYLTIKKH